MVEQSPCSSQVPRAHRQLNSLSQAASLPSTPAHEAGRKGPPPSLDPAQGPPSVISPDETCTPLAASTALTPVTLHAAPAAPCPTSSTARRMASAASAPTAPTAGTAGSSSASLIGSSASMGAAPSAGSAAAVCCWRPGASGSSPRSSSLSAPPSPRARLAPPSRRLQGGRGGWVGGWGTGGTRCALLPCKAARGQGRASAAAGPLPGLPGLPDNRCVATGSHRLGRRVSWAEGSLLRMKSTRACTSSTSLFSTTALSRTCERPGQGGQAGWHRCAYWMAPARCTLH